MSKFQSIEITLPPQNDYSTLARMKRSLYYGIFQHYVIIWSKNDEFFHEYENKLKKNLQMQSQILNYDLTEEEIDTLVAHKFTTLYTGNILGQKFRITNRSLDGLDICYKLYHFQKARLLPCSRHLISAYMPLIFTSLTALLTYILETEQAQKTLNALKERLSELQRLEKSIEEVHTLFIRLQNIIVDQSAIMQSIEKHFNDARNYVEEGTKEIAQANDLKKKNRTNKLIFIIITIIAVSLFIIIGLCKL